MSVEIPELESYIGYRLNGLAERNEHHLFEAIAVRIARKRISSNILIANGPVSSGGDQQRDAETYTTRIPNELPHSAGFSATTSTSPVVLACTVQQASLKSKVLADLEGICASSAAKVELVAFFSVTSIPEGTTHELQRIARKTYGVTLDVYSGQKLSTLLAEQDLVWIARHYLDVPASLVPEPEPETTPQWYADLLENLRLNRGPAALTSAAQGEIIAGLRHATWDADANADLPEWLDFLGAFLVDSVSDELAFRARYEMTVATFRGLGVAAPAEDLVRKAIDHAESSQRISELDDAVTLVTYWGTMWVAGLAKADILEIAAARERLVSHVQSELDVTDQETYPVRTASLIGTLVYLSLQVKWEETGIVPEPAERDSLVGQELDDVDLTTETDIPFVDLDAAMDYLERIVDLIPRARPYSVRRLSDLFSILSPSIAVHPSYAKVRDGLDTAVATVEGDAAVGRRAQERGVALARANQPFLALQELHNAKAKWFHDDLMHGAVLVVRYLAQVYLDLGLAYAAKMHACGAVVLANQSTEDDVKALVPGALLDVAESAAHAGCWTDAAAWTDIAMVAQSALAADAFDLEKHPELQDHAQNQLMELGAVRKYWPHLESVLEAAYRKSPWFDWIRAQSAGADLDPREDEEEYQLRAAAELAGPVFSDLGAERTVDFKALGTRWIFTYLNERRSVLAAEGFIAAFQVLLADVARFDPVLLATTVRVKVNVAEGDEGMDVTDEDGQIVVRLLVGSGRVQKQSRTIVAQAAALLGNIHARPMKDFKRILKQLFRDGLGLKMMIGRPYTEAADFLDDEHFQLCASGSAPASSERFIPIPNEHLGASTRPGNGYDRSRALERIEERYRVCAAWNRSAQAIVNDPRGRAAVEKAQADGWLDWQILAAIANMGLNQRVQDLGIDPTTLTPEEGHALLARNEGIDERALPVETFERDLEMHLFMQTVTVAQMWKVHARPEKPGEWVLRDLLIRRYGFAEDDVPHSDLLVIAR